MQRKIRRQIARRLRQKAKQALWTSVAAAGLLLGACGYSLANPTGGEVTGGVAAISGEGTTAVTVTQTTDKTSLNWTSFSIDAGEAVTFVQPDSSSVAVNRVTGTDVSAIYGTLTANGKVYLINPNGVLFSKSAQVNVGGIVASTLNITDSDFRSGNYTFGGESTATVSNAGTIAATDGGYVVLLGRQVGNSGTITAGSGTVALAAGGQITLDFDGDGLLGLTVDRAALGALAQNSGTIRADGGAVYLLSAAAADTLAGTVVNNSGVIRAQSVAEVNGRIVLDGGTNGTVANSGTLDVSGKDNGATGGVVKMLGETVNLADGTSIDVSGAAGGGTALIGGDYQGSGAERHAATTTVASGATINADAITTGDGGTVVVWSDGTTTFAGTISAQGGSVSGDGGAIETSSKGTLKVADTASVSTTAADGATGEWLLDPENFTLGSGTGYDMDVGTLATALANSNVTITTGANSNTVTGTGIDSSEDTSGGAEAGDITVDAALSWSSDYGLTLAAYHDVIVNAAISNSAGGDLTLRADNAGTGSGTVAFGGGGSVGLADGAASLYYNPGTATTLTVNVAGTDTNYTVSDYTDAHDYSAAITISGSGSYTAYMLVNDLYELQAIRANLAGDYALGRDIDAGATATWNYDSSSSTYRGFMPVGDATDHFTGSLDGAGQVIDGLYINRTSSDYVGLFGYATGTIRNLGLVDATVGGRCFVGALAGMNGGDISSSYNTGAVSGSYYVGGLVGRNDGTGSISSSYNTDAVSGSGGVGGLVGRNDGDISSSYNTGAVSGNEVGGLAGTNVGSISSSYNAGAVSGSDYVGGLVGWNDGTGSISSSYNAGAVSGSGGGVGGLAGLNVGSISSSYNTGVVESGSYYVGGLAGRNYGTGSISSSYNTGAVSGSDYVGGLVGLLSDAGDISSSYNAGAVSGSDYVGGLAGKNDSGDISTSYNTGVVSGSDYVGGLAGYNYNGSIINCYWNVDTSGTTGIGNGTNVVNCAGLSAAADTDGDGIADLYDAESYAGWDIATTGGSSSVWRIYEGHAAPLLKSFLTTLTVAADDVAKIYDGTAYSGALIGVTYTPGDGSTFESSLVSGTLSYGSESDAGTYTLTGLYSGQLGYDIVYSTDSTLTISPKTITISGFNAADKVYDGTTAATVNGTITNSVGGDDVTLTGSFSDKNAGSSKTVTASLSGTDAGNYTITYSSDTADIAAKALTVSAFSAADKVYDGTTAATVGGTITDAISGDDVTLTGTFSNKNAGVGKTVTAALSGTDAGNYTISYTDTADIAAKTLTVSGFSAADKVYDGTTAATVSGMITGAIGGDDVTLTGSFSDKDAGAGKTVTAVLTGTDAGNYTITYTDTANITVKTLTVSGFSAADKIYDGATVATVSGTITNAVSGDDVTLTGSFSDKNAGAGKTVTASLSGTDAGNYTVSYSDTADITVKTLTVSGFSAADKVYDGTTAATVGGTITNVVSGDDVTLTGCFSDKNAGGGKTVTAALTGADAGNYTVSYTDTADLTAKALTVSGFSAADKVYDGTTAATVSGTITNAVSGDDITLTGSFANKNADNGKIVTAALTGTDAGNYTVSYTDTADITAKALTVSGFSAADKVYDGTTAATVSGTFTNAVSGDDITLTGSFNDKNAGDGKTVTASLSGADAGNYTITYTDTAEITRAALTVAVNDATWMIGTSEPEYSVSYDGLVTGDSAASLDGTLTFTTSGTAASGAGEYSIAASGLSSGNYDIAYADGKLTIITSTADPKYNGVLAAMLGNKEPVSFNEAGDFELRIRGRGVNLNELELLTDLE
jgi:filamentous hemagglutinin family protein